MRVALALPAAAAAHAYLVAHRAVGERIMPSSPPNVALTFSEAVEPRFAIVSVTDAERQPGRPTARPARSPADPNTLLVPLEHLLPEGWYLVYWRVISVDGHPVRGAYTFQVGPNPGPAPQFPVPSISETAATPSLVAARSVAFLAVMIAIGLFVLRRRDRAAARAPRRRTRACGALERRVRRSPPAVGARRDSGLPAARDRRRSRCARRSDLGDLVPLIRASAFGRGFLDLELCFALFALAAGVALWVDRPEREQRSIAELLATGGALAAAAAVLARPRRRGPRRADRAARRLARARLDCTSPPGSIWLGGLIGLLVLWLDAARGAPARRPRRRRAAFLERRARRRCCSCSARASGRRSSTCRRSPRSGRRTTARRCS